MEVWEYFIYFVLAVACLSFASAVLVFKEKAKMWVLPLQLSALGVMSFFILILWCRLAYPPMRTMGETRLWYSFFLILAGILTYVRYGYKWILMFTAVLSLVFNLINVMKPEIHEEGLMPVLQSVWFVPHVSIYMFSYAVFAFAFVLCLVSMFRKNKALGAAIDELVYVGIALFGFGMFIGALWAKQAWGNYWTWDPKETWAAITWGLYLLYVHMRMGGKQMVWLNNTIHIMAFVAIQICWWGLKYLPNIESVHIYR